jgi:DNA-binding response OmpR family regulator
MRILVVEDEESLALRIKNVLESEKYHVDIAFEGSDGLEQAMIEEYDLLILDILLPGLNGLQILKEVRREGFETPVLLLTAKNRVEDKVIGLDAGADDYLTKPFALPELLARVRSLLRRTSEVKSSVISVGNLEVNTNSHEVKISGKPVELTQKEYSILEFLLYNKNRVLSRLSIAEHVWGDNFDLFTMTNFVDVHVKNLRKKIDQPRLNNLIETVRGVGYMIKDKG